MTPSSYYLIEQIADAQRSGAWDNLDILLGDLVAAFDPTWVGPLLGTLVDDVEHESEAFGVVHLAETVDDAAYVVGLLSALPALRRAPRWTRTLMARVLNSEITMAALLAALPEASEESRAATIDALASLEAWRPDQFAAKASLMRAAVRPGS
jgi:hypothetical protein